METVFVFVIVGLAAAVPLARIIGRRRTSSSGCSSGCGGCSCSEKRDVLVTLRR
jgi:hypothetical protein